MNRPSREDFSGSENLLRDAVTMDRYMTFCCSVTQVVSDILQPHGQIWRRKRQPTPVFLPGESLAERNLAGHGPWGHRNTTEVTKHARTVVCLFLCS